MSAKPRLVEREPRRSAEREALAVAITVWKRAQTAEQAQLAAIERHDQRVREAEKSLADMPAAMARARERDAAAMAKAAKTAGKAPAASALRKAHQREQDAAIVIEAAAAGRAHLQGELADMQYETRQAVAAVEKQAVAVLASEVLVERLIEQAERARNQAETALIWLRLMLRDSPDVDADLRTRAKHALRGGEWPVEYGRGDWSQHPADAAYQSARARLAVDADAPVEF